MKNRKLKIINQRLETGFTLIELLIAMGVFVVILGIVVNVFINALRVQRSIVFLIAANDNASLALEQMARELRTGLDFSLLPPSSLINQSDAIKFENANAEIVSYRKSNDSLERGVCFNQFTGCDDFSEYEYFSITSENVKISALTFTIFSDASAVAWPPRITVSMSVTPKKSSLEDEVITKIQTTISARNI